MIILCVYTSSALLILLAIENFTLAWKVHTNQFEKKQKKTKIALLVPVVLNPFQKR